MRDENPAALKTSSSLERADGHAALILVESLIHGLCESATLTVCEAVEIVERAADVQREFAETEGDVAGPMWRSLGLLSAIGASLKVDDSSGAAPHQPP